MSPARAILDDDGDTVRCLECDTRMRALARHLHLRHGMSADDYRTRHGLPRTEPLTARATRDRLSAHGRRRRDSDPRVLAALTSDGARAAQAAPFPLRERRPTTAAANAAARRAASQAHWQQALARAGWTTWHEAAAWAAASNAGWASVARRMGTSHTPTRRAGEAAGVHIARAQDQATRRMLELARAHADSHGSLEDTSGALASWLATRRHLARTGTASGIHARLDELDPGWADARPRGGRPRA